MRVKWTRQTFTLSLSLTKLITNICLILSATHLTVQEQDDEGVYIISGRGVRGYSSFTKVDKIKLVGSGSPTCAFMIDEG